MFAHLDRTPKPLAVLATMVALIIVGASDAWTSFEISFSVFYALPLVFGVWTVGRGYGTWLCLFAVLVWGTSDIASGHHFASQWIMIWNGCVRFCYLQLVVQGAHYARRELDHTRARADALEQALPVCSCCKKISDEHGAWVEVETYLSEHLPTRPETKLCPDCSKRVYIDKVSPDLPSTYPA